MCRWVKVKGSKPPHLLRDNCDNTYTDWDKQPFQPGGYTGPLCPEWQVTDRLGKRDRERIDYFEMCHVMLPHHETACARRRRQAAEHEAMINAKWCHCENPQADWSQLARGDEREKPRNGLPFEQALYIRNTRLTAWSTVCVHCGLGLHIETIPALSWNPRQDKERRSEAAIWRALKPKVMRERASVTQAAEAIV